MPPWILPPPTLPPAVEACREAGALWLAAPDSVEATEIETTSGWTPVWQIRDHHDGRIGHLLVYPDTCRVVVLVVAPATQGPSATQVITPYNTQTTDAEHRMLRTWAGVVAPVPAVCAQSSDADGDGRPEYVQHYVYDDTTGGLVGVWTDEDGDGTIDRRIRFTVDAWGRPVSGPSGSCADQYCSKAVTLQCPPGLTCTTNAFGLVEDMGPGLHNTYDCWTPGADRWIYTLPDVR